MLKKLQLQAIKNWVLYWVNKMSQQVWPVGPQMRLLRTAPMVIFAFFEKQERNISRAWPLSKKDIDWHRQRLQNTLKQTGACDQRQWLYLLTAEFYTDSIVFFFFIWNKSFYIITLGCIKNSAKDYFFFLLYYGPCNYKHRNSGCNIVHLLMIRYY